MTTSTAEARAEPTGLPDPEPDHVLTWRQQTVLQAIRDFGQRHGYPPTFRELGQAAVLASPSSVSCQLAVLQQTGYQRREAKRPRTVPSPASQAARGDGTLFLLRVQGDSMINAAITDGDLVVVGQEPEAEDGDIVAAKIDGEATVKTLRGSPDQVWLMPQPHTHRFQLTAQPFPARSSQCYTGPDT
jgi:repressor LexA